METTSDSTHTIKTASFEGPLDLLLSLIEARKLFISDISLAEVTGEYLAYVKNNTLLNYKEVTYFLVVAGTLVLIKSKSLLPSLALSNDEEDKIVDLEKRLMLYQAVKDVSLKIKEIFGKNTLYFKEENTHEEIYFIPDQNITKEKMATFVYGVLTAVPKAEILPTVNVEKVVSIEEMMHSLEERMEQALSFSFSTIATHPDPKTQKEARIYTIVSFLAMLELIRNGIIDVVQQQNFNEMIINKRTD